MMGGVGRRTAGTVAAVVLAAGTPVSAQVREASPDTTPWLETGAHTPMPPEWIDRDTGHRVVRLTPPGRGNRSFYFHNDPFVPGREGAADRMLYYGSTPSGPQLFLLDLRTRESEQLTHRPGGVSGEILGRRRREAFYQGRDTVFATNVDTKATRVVAVFPPGYDASVASLNSDETLLAGVHSTPEKREVVRRNPGRSFDAIFEAHLPHTIFTLGVETGELREVHEERAWLNHLQFSPTDPDLLMFCHEGPWHLLDRIWTLDLGTDRVTKIHERTVDREIAGHEFWSPDGRTIWYDLQIPRGETFFLAGADVGTGNKTRYRLTRNEWSIHFNVSPDRTLFAGDGGDSSQVAGARDGMWLYLFRPRGDHLVSERLVNLRRHDYELEPNVHFTPDGRWVVFRANFEGESQVYAVSVEAEAAQAASLDWPPVTAEQRPWTRWWWQGSAVDEAGLTAALEAYRDVGLGGVEITPIYGVAGAEDRFLDYLSPTWVERLEYTLGEARRLGLGVDMATGTGWPFGGPAVGQADEAKYVAHRTYRLSGGERLQEPVALRQEPLLRMIGNRAQVPPDATPDPLQRAGRRPLVIGDLVRPISANPHLQALALEQVRFPEAMPLQALVAYSDAGEVRVLTDHVGPAGPLDWTAPTGEWTLWAIFQGWHGKMVERAAPGGEGYALDHLSERAVDDYLDRFTEAFGGHDVSGLRAFFNDSYEVDDAQGEADWTPGFFDAFQARRGYDLRTRLPALFGEADEDTSRRVLTDYRETVSDLLLEAFTRTWAAWAAGRGALVRDQAHGSPANILDLYAAADIPETEGRDVLRFKLATSAAHVAGRPLASAETATWLNEHFLSNLADVKEAVDRTFLGGVNHVVYHGTAYSPEDAPWPGWLFYAAVHFSPTNPLWTDFAALNAYVARAQSILQGGRPDNDVLLYLPMFDRWARRDRSLLVHVDGMEPFQGMTVADDAALLEERGWAFDLVSDRQLQAAQAVDGQVRTGGLGYRAVVVPEARLLPPETLEALAALAEGGATVIFHRGVPGDVPGLGDLTARRAAFRDALARLRLPNAASGAEESVAVGRGRVLLGDDLEGLLARAAVRREAMVDSGLGFVRRRRDGGTDWFVVNRGDSAVDGWVPLAASLSGAPVAVALFDPMTGATGVARLRAAADGATEVYLQLAPGESAVARGWDRPIEGAAWRYQEPEGPPQVLEGTWRVHFGDGGPEPPPDLELDAPGSWTDQESEAARAFSGTATYTVTFPRPEGTAERWRLDLGEVRESARVRLNGEEVGTLIGPSYALLIDDALLEVRNVLEVDVSNLMANRIAAMDRRGEPWKRFYNVDFPANQRGNTGPDGLFDASGWEPLPSGLLGPVTLTPLRSF